MKNKLFAMLAFLSFTIGGWAADAPLFMAFLSTDGSICTMDAEGLEMTVAGGNLIVTNGTDSHEFTLTDLSKMYFTGEAALKELLSDSEADQAVTVFTADGRAAGKFESAAKAVNSLPAGIYLVSTASGKNFKIAVK